MRKYVLLAGLLASNAYAGDAKPLVLGVERVTIDGGTAEAILKLRNNTQEGLSAVFAQCAFLDKSGVAVDIGTAMWNNVPPGGEAYAKAMSVKAAGTDSASCRLTSVR